MTAQEAFSIWRSILNGRRPTLSIEITRECPLRCPGCYAYEDAHLGGEVTLRQLADHRGSALIKGVLDIVDRYRPVHLSLVGGDPLVRYRELEILVPEIIGRGIHVQVVTSAFRPLPPAWATLPQLNVAVSIDGLPAEHDARRKPATYDRILKNIQGQHISVHCTVTGQMTKRSGYLEDFLRFWTSRKEVRRVWISLFTPQRGHHSPECLTADARNAVVEDLLNLRRRFAKLDMSESMIRAFLAPPASPRDCIFACTTHVLSADLKTAVVPCQFGGDPDCSRCGCAASIGMAALANRKLAGLISIGGIFQVSRRIGATVAAMSAPSNLDGVPQEQLL